jgi:hypothetical protein
MARPRARRYKFTAKETHINCSLFGLLLGLHISHFDVS